MKFEYGVFVERGDTVKLLAGARSLAEAQAIAANLRRPTSGRTVRGYHFADAVCPEHDDQPQDGCRACEEEAQKCGERGDPLDECACEGMGFGN